MVAVERKCHPEQLYKPSVNKTDIIFPCTVIGKNSVYPKLFVGTNDIQLGLWTIKDPSWEAHKEYDLLHPSLMDFRFGWYIRHGGDMRIVKTVRAERPIMLSTG